MLSSSCVRESVIFLYKSLVFFHFIDYSQIFYFFSTDLFFILCGVILSVWLW